MLPPDFIRMNHGTQGFALASLRLPRAAPWASEWLPFGDLSNFAYRTSNLAIPWLKTLDALHQWP